MSGKGKNLDVYLAEVFKQFVAIKDNDLKKSQEVFKSVFDQVKQKMGEQCNFFCRYATQVMYAGSVYDGIKVSKMDEFDMDIVIRLPISYDGDENGIMLENDEPGFVKMKITKAFDNLDKQQDWETRHKVTRDWRDSDKYLLQNKFRQWMHKVLQKTINEMDGRVEVNGDVYELKYRTCGPAYTLNVTRSEERDFSLDVDLVPVIRFMTPRWPEGYRRINGSLIREWLVVPKPNNSIQDENNRNRCWRLSFQDYEREMMKGCQQLKNTIRLVKKLRDATSMKAIASYYIKTLFLWKITKTNKKYWETKLSVTFRDMVEELYNAIVAKKIPYFWNENNNLIAGVKPTILKVYEDRLKAILCSIQGNDVDMVVAYLLTPDELVQFKESSFYQSQVSLRSTSSSNVSRQESVTSNNNVVDEMDVDKQKFSKIFELIKNLTDKVDDLADKVSLLDDRVRCLEVEKKCKNHSAVDDLNGLSFNVNSVSLVHELNNVKKESVDNAMFACKSDPIDLLTL